MMIKTKDKLTTILILIFALMIGALLATPSNVSTKAAMNYVGTIAIRNSEDGYLYGNNDTFMKADTLQAVFDDVVSNTTNVAKFSFENVTTSETLVFNYERKIVLESGALSHVGKNGQTLIELATGVLEIAGAQISTDNANVIKVCEGAEFTLSSGFIAINERDLGQTQPVVLYNDGNCTITGGQVLFSSEINGSSGQGIAQTGANASLIIKQSGIGITSINGKNALYLSGGTAVIDGGLFNGKFNGIALNVRNNASVTINGGEFSSDNADKVVVLEGNANSVVNYNGGLINGKIWFNRVFGGNGTALKILGRRILSSENGNVIVYADDGVLNVNDARLGFVEGVNGNYLIGWEGIDAQNPLVTDFADRATILAKTNNEYAVRLIVGSQTIDVVARYGSSINDLIDETAIPNGYRVKKWKSSGVVVLDPKVTGNDEFVAELELVAPRLSPIDNVIKAYDGKEVVRSANVAEVQGLIYKYVWQKRNIVNDWIGVLENATITFLERSDSGQYRLQVSVTDGNLTAVSYSSVFDVEINYGTYTSVTHQGFDGIYDKEISLAEYHLNDGFRWVDPSVVPTVKQKEYDAIYCLEPENYYEFALKIIIDLEKAETPAPIPHNVISKGYIYSNEKTLKDYPFLEKEWRWQNLSTIPQAGTHAYPAYYNLDVDNYLDYATEVTLVIEKAEYTQEEAPDLRITIPYINNLNVAYVISEYALELGNYSFSGEVLKETKLNQIKEFAFDAYYNADKNNYKDFACKIIVKVTKGIVLANYNEDNVIEYGVYEPNKILGDIQLLSDWRWLDEDTELVAGENTYTLIYNPNKDLYEDYKLEVLLRVERATITHATHRQLTGVYSCEQTLLDFTLDAGWTWVNVSETPTVSSQSYLAIYQPNDNYYPYATSVILALERGEIDVSAIKFEGKTVTYNGQDHNIQFTGKVPNGLKFDRYSQTSPLIKAGVYECRAYFIQTDKVNYKTASTIFTAVVVVNKATLDVSGITLRDKEFVYTGEPKYLEIEGDLPSGVSVEYFNNGKVKAGKHVVEVGFNLADSENYNAIEPLMATLTITKATANMYANEKYVYAYDGNEHIPNVTIDNNEQTISYEVLGNAKEVGEHVIKFFAQESANYKYLEKFVTVVINKTSVECGRLYKGEITALIGKVTNVETGIGDGAELTMGVTLLSNEEITFDILLNGEVLEGDYMVNVLIPDGMRGEPKVYLKNGEEYVELESIVSGNYIIFSTPKLGTHRIVATEEWDIVNDGALEWWGWLLISISIAIVISGVVVFVILYKKGLIRKKK